MPPEVNNSTIFFTYQSQGVAFDRWIELLTLCFAPLAAHVAFGTSDAVVCGEKAPSWMDRIAQFNPTTITWRYYAIAYRRLRTRNWGVADMAAANASFFESRNGGWNGSESIMLRSREWLIRPPRKPYISFMSASTVMTIAVALQGCQEVYIVSEFWKNRNSLKSLSKTNLATTFFPLAILSLLRLASFPWLSSDYAYKYTDPDNRKEEGNKSDEISMIRLDTGESFRRLPLTNTSTSSWPTVNEFSISDHEYQRDRNGFPPFNSIGGKPNDLFFSNTIDTESHLTGGAFSHLRPQSNPQCVAFLIWWIITALSIGGLGLVTSIYGLGPRPGIIITTVTGLLQRLIYIILSIMGLTINCYYVTRGEAKSTFIPCINTRWYKALSLLLVVLAFAAIIFGCLETWILPDGSLTTFPKAFVEAAVAAANQSSYP